MPGEVPLTPGKTYCAEFAPFPANEPYNAAVVNHPLNEYPQGSAWRDGKAIPTRDLEMTIVEYQDCPVLPPWPKPVEVANRNLLENGHFEADLAKGQSAVPPGWSRWSSGKTTFWYGRYGRDGSGAARVIGGNINDTRIDGGYVQPVAGLDKRKTYCLSGWSASSAMSDARYLSAIGYDPTGQTADPKAQTIIWGVTGRFTALYEQVIFRGIRPTNNAISVWTHGANKEVGNSIFTVDFDDFGLVEEK
jgi:hypothetical protein